MATSKEVALYSRVLAEKEEAKKRLKQSQTRSRPVPGRPQDMNLDEAPALTLGSSSPSLTKRPESLLSKSASTASSLGGTNSQVARLKVAIQALRDEISGERHDLAVKERLAGGVESEAAFMGFEDDVAEQREAASKVMQDKRDELVTLEQRHLETLAYNNVLVFMEKRLQGQKITFRGTLSGYEDALRLIQTESKVARAALMDARKAKLEEEVMLGRFQQAARRHKAAMEAQLEKLKVQASLRESLYEMSDVSRRMASQDLSTDSLLEGEDPANFGKPWKKTNPAQPQLSPEVLERYYTLKKGLLAMREAAEVASKTNVAAEIIARYGAVKDDSTRLDTQLLELRGHVDHLTEFRAKLKEKAEPRGDDSPTTALHRQAEGGGRMEGMRRQHAAVKDEFELLRSAKVQLEQSIGVLRSRLSTFVTLPHELGGREGGASLVDDISKVAQKLGSLAVAVGEEVNGGGKGIAPSRSTRPSVSPAINRQRSNSNLEREFDAASRREALRESESALPRSEFNIRVRPGSGGLNKLSAKQLSAAADTFIAVQAKLSASTASLPAYGRLSPLAKKGESLAASTRSLSKPSEFKFEEEDMPGGNITAMGSRLLADAGISLELADSDSDGDKKRAAPSGDRRKRRSPRDTTSAAEDRGKNKRQLQLQKFAAAAVVMCGDEPEEGVAAKDSELVPNRDMVKHKARLVVQRNKPKKTARADD